MLAATDDVQDPSPVTAYSPDKPKPDEAAAPLALKTAVKPPTRLRSLRVTPQARARIAAATRRVIKKAHHR